MKKYSREQEAKLPSFKNHGQARMYFKNKYGCDFMMMDSEVIDEMKIYFYIIILNRVEYEKGVKQLTTVGYSEGFDFLNSYQSIEIYEDGNIHMVH